MPRHERPGPQTDTRLDPYRCAAARVLDGDEVVGVLVIRVTTWWWQAGPFWRRRWVDARELPEWALMRVGPTEAVPDFDGIASADEETVPGMAYPACVAEGAEVTAIAAISWWTSTARAAYKAMTAPRAQRMAPARACCVAIASVRALRSEWVGARRAQDTPAGFPGRWLGEAVTDAVRGAGRGRVRPASPRPLPDPIVRRRSRSAARGRRTGRGRLPAGLG